MQPINRLWHVCRGKVVKGVETVVRSRYDEDVFHQNHTSVWGSYWENGKWGYACCKSLVKNSMCLGDKAEAVAQQNASMMAANAERVAAERAAAASSAQPSGAPSCLLAAALCAAGPACRRRALCFDAPSSLTRSVDTECFLTRWLDTS